jgi:hypothetical protein
MKNKTCPYCGTVAIINKNKLWFPHDRDSVKSEICCEKCKGALTIIAAQRIEIIDIEPACFERDDWNVIPSKTKKDLDLKSASLETKRYSDGEWKLFVEQNGYKTKIIKQAKSLMYGQVFDVTISLNEKLFRCVGWATPGGTHYVDCTEQKS